MTTMRHHAISYALAIFGALTFAGSAIAAGPSEGLVYSFLESGGGNPQGNLVADSAGNLYGTASQGSSVGGIVYELLRPVSPSTQWTLNVLYTFSGSDGSSPIGGVIFDNSGNLYGTTSLGGTSNLGVVFELSPPGTGGGQWTETVLHSFQGGATDGKYPGWGVVFDSSGNLYGVAPQGGLYCSGLGCGVVFELTPTTGGAWKETVIHVFDGGGAGAGPVGTPILDGKGNLYGSAGGGDNGVVYRLAPPATEGGAWNYKVLYKFAGGTTDGTGPYGSLTLRGDGNLYGITATGGENNLGTVFEVMPPSVPGSKWTDTILHSFGASGDGGYPGYNLIFDKAGNLYGTTQLGGGDGTCNDGGCGTVYELSPPATGGNWTETILHRFPAYAKDGSEPSSGLLPSKEGALFGVTALGGVGGSGAVYRVIP